MWILFTANECTSASDRTPAKTLIFVVLLMSVNLLTTNESISVNDDASLSTIGITSLFFLLKMVIIVILQYCIRESPNNLKKNSMVSARGSMLLLDEFSITDRTLIIG